MLTAKGSLIRLYFYIPKMILYLIQLIFLSEFLKKGKDLGGFYARISEQQCSDKFTNDQFVEFDQIINLHGVKRATGALIVLAIIIGYNFFVEAILHFSWCLTCGCCRIWRARAEKAERHYQFMLRARTVTNDTLKPSEAPGLETRRELAMGVGASFI